MDIRHLQYINEIVKQRSFTKAAESLHIAQPTISKSIRNLENELRFELFNRDSKTVKLTDAGEVVYRYAQPILQLFDSLTAEVNDLSFLQKGTISIGLPPMAGSRFFPSVLKQFQERYPGISVQMVEYGAVRIEESVGSGNLDVGVVLTPVDTELFESIPLVREKLNVILPASHPFSGRKSIALSELSSERFILFSNEFTLHDRIIGHCRDAGFAPNIVYESSQWDFITEMVASDLGIAMLPETICRALDSEQISSVPLTDPVIPWELVMVWKREGYLSLAAKAWIAFVEEMFA
ncbi:LysR family transcriptional regulator [Paenibacillus gorillae]|uniref:LysR family transcriptional regulator n=1 Tax=Paenibacillus gorillae TaxID=1243662 RepID=UPI0004ADA38C|nr:LysR family transcriptional regulator [Paenibacillus gorillae]